MTGNDDLVERKMRPRIVALNELIDGVAVSALRLARAKAVEDGRSTVIKIRKTQSCPGFPRFTPYVSAHADRLHRGWP